MSLIKDNFLHFGILFCIFIRWLVSRFPYSGAGKKPMYGDFEAQRHWMEITTNLAARDWYTNSSRNDLLYWGLDYPPLTAYHMYLNGKLAEYINPRWTRLFDSRGMESYYLKIFMRSSVLASDLLIYFTSLIAYWSIVKIPSKPRDKAIFVFLSLLYPGLILIDHGHFQYNCVSLGLTVSAVCLLQLEHFVLGSVFFTLALTYKQMSLYHALPFFCYILGRIMKQPSKREAVSLFFKVSASVLITFLVCFAPFLSNMETAMQVFRRLFPLDRGLYEDKVANIWCSMEVVIKLKKLFSQYFLATLCGGVTLAAILPSSWNLLRNPTIDTFKYALVNSSLIFFLCSFQVHEKSILLVALPVTLLLNQDPLAGFWFSLISVFSLQPLLIKDVLSVAYYALTIVYITAFTSIYGDFGLSKNDGLKAKARTIIFVASMMVCLFLSLTTSLIKPPARYPDIFKVLNAIISCIHFLGFAIYYHFKQFNTSAAVVENGYSHTKLKKRVPSEGRRENLNYSPRLNKFDTLNTGLQKRKSTVFKE